MGRRRVANRVRAHSFVGHSGHIGQRSLGVPLDHCVNPKAGDRLSTPVQEDVISRRTARYQ